MDNVEVEKELKMLRLRYESLSLENERLRRDKEVINETLDYLVAGIEQMVKSKVGDK